MSLPYDILLLGSCGPRSFPRRPSDPVTPARETLVTQDCMLVGDIIAWKDGRTVAVPRLARVFASLVLSPSSLAMTVISFCSCIVRWNRPCELYAYARCSSSSHSSFLCTCQQATKKFLVKVKQTVDMAPGPGAAPPSARGRTKIRSPRITYAHAHTLTLQPRKHWATVPGNARATARASS